ncbi:Uncharacterized protein GBIM_10449, partial [Gryllus bimaculatus]
APPDAPTAPDGATGYPYQPSPQPPFPQPTTSQQPPPYEPPVGDDGGTDLLGDGQTALPDATVSGSADVETKEPAADAGQHPPHIHKIDVQCAKDQMIIEIETSYDSSKNAKKACVWKHISIESRKLFPGRICTPTAWEMGHIFSQLAVMAGVMWNEKCDGFYRQDACRYVNENSGQTKYSITVRLDSCGTQFVDQFAEGGQAYLENVLVLQNEPGIQEVKQRPRIHAARTPHAKWLTAG